MYNGYSRKDVTEKGAAKLSVLVNVKQGIMTRGILMDMPKLVRDAVHWKGAKRSLPSTWRPGKRRQGSKSGAVTRS